MTLLFEIILKKGDTPPGSKHPTQTYARLPVDFKQTQETLLADRNSYNSVTSAIGIYALPILNTFVPQIGQVPRVAGLRFLSTTWLGFFISTFFLHFIQ